MGKKETATRGSSSNFKISSSMFYKMKKVRLWNNDTHFFIPQILIIWKILLHL